MIKKENTLTVTNMLETNEKTESLIKEIWNLSKNIEAIKRNQINFGTEKYNNQS